jgi:hypothetical protein
MKSLIITISLLMTTAVSFADCQQDSLSLLSAFEDGLLKQSLILEVNKPLDGITKKTSTINGNEIGLFCRDGGGDLYFSKSSKVAEKIMIYGNDNCDQIYFALRNASNTSVVVLEIENGTVKKLTTKH